MSTWKLRERLGDRILRRIGDRADLAAVQVLEDEDLEDVVDLLVLKRSSVEPLPLTVPKCSKYPTPEEKSTTLATGTVWAPAILNAVSQAARMCARA